MVCGEGYKSGLAVSRMSASMLASMHLFCCFPGQAQQLHSQKQAAHGVLQAVRYSPK